MNSFARKNTAKIQFPAGSNQPSDKEMIDFILELGLTSPELHSVYKDVSDSCIYVKFNTENFLAEFLTKTPNNITFNYFNKSNAKVTISDANIEYSYVRIFNLPPEIEDKDIKDALNKYGQIKTLNREKFPISFGLDVFSGVRGVFMELSADIPNFMYIQRFRARIHYNGQQEICFLCKSNAHKKNECPQNISIKQVISNSDPMTHNPIASSSRAFNITNLAKSVNKPSKPIEDDRNLTVMPLSSNSTRSSANIYSATNQSTNKIKPSTKEITPDVNVINSEDSDSSLVNQSDFLGFETPATSTKPIPEKNLGNKLQPKNVKPISASKK